MYTDDQRSFIRYIGLLFIAAGVCLRILANDLETNSRRRAERVEQLTLNVNNETKEVRS